MEEDQYEGDGVAGWPLGLPPVTLQMRLANAFSSTLHPHASFLLHTPSCSSLGSSDLDTESSLFSIQARSITLGSLMGMRSGSEPSLMRARSLAAASNCSQVSTSHPHHQALELCRKLIRRRHFKRIAVDSAKLWSSFLIRFSTCMQAQTHSGSTPHLQPIDQDTIAAPSLAHLLQADRVPHNDTVAPTEASNPTVFMNVMYEGAPNVENLPQNPPFEAAPHYDGAMNEVALVNSRVKGNRKGTCGAIKRRVKRKYLEWEALSKSPCIPCM